MSLQLRMNGEIMDLNPDGRVDMELVSPLLTYDDILSGKSTIPNLPKTAKNRKILGFPDMLQVALGTYRYRSEQYWNGSLLETGAALLTEAGEEYTFAVVQALGEFFGDKQQRLLPEIEMGGIVGIGSGVDSPGNLPAAPVLQVAGQNAVCFPTVLNPDFYGTNGASIGYGGRMNPYAAGAYQTTGPIVPMVFLRFLIQRIAQITGTLIDGTFFSHPATADLILFNTRALDGDSTILFQRHLPDLKLGEFFLELRKLLNLAITIRPAEGRMTLDFTDDLLAKPCVLDWSAKALQGYVKRPEPNRRLQLGSEWDSGDGYVKDKPAETLDYLTPEGDGAEGIAPLKTKFSTLLVDAATQTAKCSQAGVTTLFGQLNQKFGARMLFFNGMIGGLPVASPNRAGYSLFWNGPDGLAARFWSKTEAMRKEQFYLQRDFDWTETDVATLDFGAKVHVNGVNYLVARGLVSLPVTRPAQVLLVRCP